MGSRVRALVVGIYLHFLTLFLPGYKVGRFRQTPMGPVEFIYGPLECWISLSFRRSTWHYIIYYLPTTNHNLRLVKLQVDWVTVPVELNVKT